MEAEGAMRIIQPGGIRRAALTLAATIALVLLGGAPAFAHNPVLLDETDVLPWAAPLAPDGTVSMAFYGSLPHPAAVRSAQFTLRAGEPLHVELLIPDLAPENQLARARLPRLVLIAPEGRITVLRPTLREPFYEEFSRQHLIYLARYDAVAAPGTYSMVLTGAAGARFVAVSGQREVFGVPLERGTYATIGQLQQWYAGAP
jgi:hypothetical protein